MISSAPAARLPTLCLFWIVTAACAARAAGPATVPPTAEESVRTTAAAPNAARWWKGNTHTHSLWSDGDGFPEMIVDWYREKGYDFLAMTDHDPPPPERWIPIPASGERRAAYEAYRERFGAEWVRERRDGDTLRVGLRRHDEYRSLFEEPDRFLLVPGEEITQYIGGKGAHVNALNIVEPIAPQTAPSAVEIIRRNIALVREQEARAGRPMLAVLNHPNFLWSQTAEDLIALPELRFFEVYNGHPLVHNLGDSLHASTERIWDIVLTSRARSGRPLLFGVATDDAHDYHRFASQHRNPGRGWIVVRSPLLHADSLMAAMHRGDFYASTGVELEDVRRDGRTVRLVIRGDPGVTYTTQFIGTRAGHDTTSRAVTDTAGNALTRRYGGDVGAVLAEVRGTAPSYSLRGDELYLRARVVSSRRKENPSEPDQVEMAWTQPFIP